jgi:hypothetical protein
MSVRRAAVGLAVLLSACAHPRARWHTMDVEDGEAPHLRAGRGFRPEVEARLNALLDAKGKGSPDYDPVHPPVAVFDWDNTMMKNDIGDATFWWALQQQALRAPPDGQWRRSSPLLSDAAVEVLTQACPVTPGGAVPTGALACADALRGIYGEGKLPDHSPAFPIETSQTLHAPYAFGAELFAGHTADEVRALAASALAAGEAEYQLHRADLAQATQRVGSGKETSYVHIYEAMHNLVSTLQVRGFDVWVVSASMQELAETAAAEVGVPADHVVGVRLLEDAQGRKTPDIADCGGMGLNRVIPFDSGKRCWINKAIFKLDEEKQLQAQPEPGVRPVLAAGDSDTDVAMVDDASAVHLVIHRHKQRLTCHALLNADKRWLVQPMFIEPERYHTAPFLCHDVKGPNGEGMEDMMDPMVPRPEVPASGKR